MTLIDRQSLTETNPQRNIAIDFVKGVLIWMVVFGHMIQFVVYAGDRVFFSDPVFSFIYIFHMPLFAFLSGYFFNPGKVMNQSLHDIVRYRGRQILLPMLVWVAIIVLSKAALGFYTSSFSTIGWIKDTIVALSGSYWFLWAIFFSFLITSISVKMQSYILLLAITLLLIAAPMTLLPVGAFTAYMTSFMLPFFVFGWAASQWFSDNTDRRVLYAFLMSLPVFAFIYFTWTPENFAYVNQVNIFSSPLDVLFMFVGGAVGCIFIFTGFYLLYSNSPKNVIFDWVARLGSITLPIYLAQNYVFWTINNVIDPDAMTYPKWVSLLFCVVGATIIVTLIEYLVKLTRSHAKLRILLWGG